MVLTIKGDGMRFNGRAGAIIYNEDMTKILVEKQANDRYMFPGGRIEVYEDSFSTVNRELKEELGISCDLKLRYIMEMFLKGKYHEIGFYYVSIIDEKLVSNGFNSLDGDSIFLWINVSELDNYSILGELIKEKVIQNEILADYTEHIVFRRD